MDVEVEAPEGDGRYRSSRIKIYPPNLRRGWLTERLWKRRKIHSQGMKK